MSNVKIMKRLVVLVKPLILYMILAITLGVLGFLASTFITVLAGYILLDIISLKVGVFVLILLGITRGFLRYGEQASNHYIAFKLLALIRDKIFAVLRKLAPAKLEVKDKGNLISIITSDIELLEVFYAHTISPIAIAIIMSIIMTLFIASFNALLGIVALVAYVSVGYLLPVYISKKSANYGKEFRDQSGELSSFVLDSLRGINEIIQFGKGEVRTDEIVKQTEELSEKEKKLKEVMSINLATSNLLVISFSVLMAIVSSSLYLSGMIGFDGVVIPTIAMFSSFGPVIALANLGSTLQVTFAAGERVLNILDEEPLVKDITGKTEINANEINAKGITFSYDKDEILQNVDLNVTKNKITGIVGKSGSGKSTLLKLFMRFWEIDEGKIDFDNTNINDVNTDNLRDMESFVTQSTVLFNDSIKNNIKISKLNATDEEVIEAAKKASIHDFIVTLKDGYDTNIGELGDLLSSGEKQRIGLARTFLHDSNFIFLDEPTSNLDTLNEAIVLKSVKEEAKDKSVVIVTHRDSTLSIADSVYKMDEGRVS